MEPMARMALRAARTAGKHIIRAFDRPDLIKISQKGPNDYVTDTDKEVERIIIEELKSVYPDHNFVGEENVFEPENPDAEYQWVIDPIDGTTNFTHNLPHFCISIACMFKGKVEHGVILDPLRQEEFVTSRGKGCAMNGHRLRVRDTNDLKGAMISTGGREDEDIATAQGNIYAELISQGAIMRQGGSAALDLAYIAAGRLDAMWMRNLNLWDIAAGALMVQEAGGRLGDFAGGASHMRTGNIIAAGPKVFRALTPVVKQHLGHLI